MKEKKRVKIELEDPSDYRETKRLLLRFGVQNGYLHLDTIKECLSEKYVTSDEMEIFFFTLEALEIELIE